MLWMYFKNDALVVSKIVIFIFKYVWHVETENVLFISINVILKLAVGLIIGKVSKVV